MSALRRMLGAMLQAVADELRSVFRARPVYESRIEDDEDDDPPVLPLHEELELQGELEPTLAPVTDPPPPPTIQPVRCPVCHRVLRSKDSIARGTGKRCHAKIRKQREGASDGEATGAAAPSDSAALPPVAG